MGLFLKINSNTELNFLSSFNTKLKENRTMNVLIFLYLFSWKKFNQQESIFSYKDNCLIRLYQNLEIRIHFVGKCSFTAVFLQIYAYEEFTEQHYFFLPFLFDILHISFPENISNRILRIRLNATDIPKKSVTFSHCRLHLCHMFLVQKISGKHCYTTCKKIYVSTVSCVCGGRGGG